LRAKAGAQKTWCFCGRRLDAAERALWRHLPKRQIIDAKLLECPRGLARLYETPRSGAKRGAQRRKEATHSTAKDGGQCGVLKATGLRGGVGCASAEETALHKASAGRRKEAGQKRCFPKSLGPRRCDSRGNHRWVIRAGMLRTRSVSQRSILAERLQLRSLGEPHRLLGTLAEIAEKLQPSLKARAEFIA
jgi:hypothetical protein